MLSSTGVHSTCRPHEESSSVPFFCRYPEVIPSGSVSDTLVSTVDVAPTLCSLAGIDDLPEADGSDRSPSLERAQTEVSSSVFIGIPKAFQHSPTPDSEWRGVRTERYTYARWSDGSPWVLFDNEADPYQQHNLISEDGATDILERLDDEVDQWIERTGDPNGSGDHLLRRVELVETWNERERIRNPDRPNLID
jgi:arylsulfatase A-like enzyme